MTDVIVVGAGPAGATLAVALGRRGFAVELFEQAHFPRDKACGEGLLPAGVGVLRSLDLADAVGGQRLSGVRYHLTDGSVRTGFAAADAEVVPYGLGQRRLHLDATLWAAAARTPGVRALAGQRVEGLLREGGRVSGVVVGGEARRARLVVAADGSRSLLRRRLGLENVVHPRRVGLRAHFQRPKGAVPLSDIEIFLRVGYEIYVTPLPNDEVLVAALAHEHAAKGDFRGGFRRWIAREPLLQGWLDGAHQVSELLGRGPLVSSTRGREPPGFLLLGDAAGSVDPITAGGLSLALKGAELLAEHAGELLDGRPLARRRFERARARALRVHRWLGGSVLALSGRPRLAELFRRGLSAHPAAMQALVALAGGA